MDSSVNRATRSAFEAGLVACYPRLFPLALRLCRNRADAHDLVQDTLERGLRCRAHFRTGDAPDRWMSTILRRIFVDGHRSRRRRARHVAIDDRREPAAPPPEPEERPAWEALTVEDVQLALRSIDPTYRETFALFALENHAQRDIAQQLSISSRTVATRVFRTREKLRELLAAGA